MAFVYSLVNLCAVGVVRPIYIDHMFWSIFWQYTIGGILGGILGVTPWGEPGVGGRWFLTARCGGCGGRRGRLEED